MSMKKEPLIHIIRHGQALHNVDRKYAYRDPPLTDAGVKAAKAVRLPVTPDLVLISPMTRTIQTAMNIFPDVVNRSPPEAAVQIWPDLREAHDAICNKGLDRDEISAEFPGLDFAECPEIWDTLPPNTVAGAVARAEMVRERLKRLSATYQNIVVITHRGFIAFLVKGNRFDVCETRSYRWATGQEVATEAIRMAVNVDTNELQDFGPTLLVEDKSLMDAVA